MSIDVQKNVFRVFSCFACVPCVLHVLVFFVFLAFRCDIIVGLGTRGKTGLWATVPVAGEGGEQGATNVAFPPPLEVTIMGQGGRKGDSVAKNLHFFAISMKFHETVSSVWSRASPRQLIFKK